MTLNYDPNDPSIREDPFTLYDRLRKEDPVHWSPHLKGWVVTRYNDVQRVARDSVMSVDKFTPFYQSLPVETRPKVEELIRYLSLWLVFRDPPDHTRLRLLLQRAFTSSSLQRVRPNVEHIVEHLLDELADETTVDLVRKFAVPLPAYVIMDMLGVPRERMAAMKTWSEDMQLFVGSSQAAPDKYERAHHGIVHMATLFRDLVAERRRSPQDDVLSALVQARDTTHSSGLSTVLSDDELVASCILFLFAGHETTTLLLASATYYLLKDPALADRLRVNPALAPTAVEEMLRFDGPIKSFARVATTDHDFAGRRIRAGDRVFAMVGSANRDPDAFEFPNRIELARNPNPHLTFGFGTHFCLGAPLARMEAQIALPKLLSRFPEMRLLVDQPVWIDSMIMRGLSELPIELRKSKAMA